MKTHRKKVKFSTAQFRLVETKYKNGDKKKSGCEGSLFNCVDNEGKEGWPEDRGLICH